MCCYQSHEVNVLGKGFFLRKERPNEAVKTGEHNRTLPLAVLVQFSALLGVLALIQDGLKTKNAKE